MSAIGFFGGLVQGFNQERQFQLQRMMFEREQKLQEKQFDFFSMMKQKEFDQNTEYLKYKAGVEQKKLMFDVGERKLKAQQEQQRIGIEQQELGETKRYHDILASQKETGFDLQAKLSPRRAELMKLIAAAQQTGTDATRFEQELAGIDAVLAGGGEAQGLKGESAAPAAEAPPAEELPQGEEAGPPAEEIGQVEPVPPEPSGTAVMTQTMAPGLVAAVQRQQQQRNAPPPPSPKAQAIAERAYQPRVKVHPLGTPKAVIDKDNAAFKLLGMPTVAVAQEELDEAELKRLKRQWETDVMEAKTSDKKAASIQDELNRRGIPVVIDAVGQRNTHVNNYAAARSGLFGAGGSLSASSGYSEIEAPKIEVVPSADTGGARGMALRLGIASPRGFFNDPQLADKFVNALADINAKSPDQVNMPIIEGARDFIRQGREQLKEMLDGKKSVKDQPFAAVLEPDNTQAIKLAASLDAADQKLEALAAGKGPYQRVGPFLEVKPGETHPVDVLDRFQDAVSTVNSMTRSMGRSSQQMEDVNSKLLGELQLRLRPDQDGTYGEGAQKRAKEVLQSITDDSSVSDEFKAQTARILMPIASGVARGQPVEASAPKPEQPKKSTSQAEQAPRRGGAGIGGIRGMLTMAAMGAQENVAAAQKDLGAVATAKKRDEAAETAYTTVKREWSQMTEAEKKTVKDTWRSLKKKWEQLKVSAAKINQIEDFLNPKPK